MLLALAVAPTASATEIGSSRPFGLGIQLGSPSGITGKYYLGGRRNALSFALGSHYGDDFYDGLWLTGSYDFHMTELASGGGVAIPWRVGVGGFLATNSYGYGRYRNGAFLGARVPVGLDFDLEQAPVQFYVEVAANLVVWPGIYGGLDAGIGARYYF
jgi:hypothetical protein